MLIFNIEIPFPQREVRLLGGVLPATVDNDSRNEKNPAPKSARD